MADRFYCADLTGSNASLDSAEAHHALHVMRVKIGQQVTLFDGVGTTAVATVHTTNRREVCCDIVNKSFTERRREGAVTILAVPPKGERLKWLVEKLTEVGVDRFIPLRCERAVVDPRQSKLEKLPATVISAAKQCGRSWLMEIGDPVELSEFLNATPPDSTRILMAHPATKPVLPSQTSPDRETSILIGPEGGFTEAELLLAEQNGANLVAWPGPILRTETAAVAFATMALACQPGR